MMMLVWDCCLFGNNVWLNSGQCKYGIHDYFAAKGQRGAPAGMQGHSAFPAGNGGAA